MYIGRPQQRRRIGRTVAELLSVTFVVERPLSTNAYYARGKGKRLFVTRPGQEFRARIEAAALIARQHSSWPALDQIACVEISYQLYDYRGDTDGPRKILRDACEGILYENDRIVQDGRAPLPIRDGKGKRVEVTVQVVRLKEEPQALPKRGSMKSSLNLRAVRGST